MAVRLREEISGQAQDRFKQHQLITPVSDVSLLLFVSLNGPSSIAEIARALEYSHQRVALRIDALHKLKLISRTVDKKDQRRKLIKLTRTAQKEMVFIEKVFVQASKKIEEMFQEIDVNLMDKIQQAITYLQKNPIVDPS